MINDHKAGITELLDAFIALRFKGGGAAVSGDEPAMAIRGAQDVLNRADHRNEIAVCQGFEQELVNVIWQSVNVFDAAEFATFCRNDTDPSSRGGKREKSDWPDLLMPDTSGVHKH